MLPRSGADVDKQTLAPSAGSTENDVSRQTPATSGGGDEKDLKPASSENGTDGPKRNGNTSRTPTTCFNETGAIIANSGGGYEHDDDVSQTPAAPDGGYGWLIVFASFMCDCMADGVAFSFGVLMDEFLDYFRESNSKTSWVGSLFHGIPLIAGPLASALITRYGCRWVCMAGGVLTSLGFIISFFAVNIDYLCFSFGLLSGFGLSLVYTPAVVIVAFYFDKKRSFATGLAASGSGIGSLIFAPLIEYLIGIYGWKGTLWILGGIMLNFVVCGALFRPVETKSQRTIRRNLRTFDEILSRENSECGGNDAASDLDKTLVARHNGRRPSRNMLNLIQTSVVKSDIEIPTFIDGRPYRRGGDREDGGATVDLDEPGAASSIANGRLQNGQVRIFSDSENEEPLLEPNQCNKNHISHRCGLESARLTAKHKSLAHCVSTSRIMVPLPDYRRGAVSFSCPNVFDSDSEVETAAPGREDRRAAGCCDRKLVRKVWSEMFDLNILKQPTYFLFFVSNFILYVWYDVAYFFLPEFATQQGISAQNAAWSVAILGVMNTIGQIFFGYLGDLPRLRTAYVYAVAIGLCGIATTFTPLCTDFASICVYSALFGFFIGADYALCSVIIIEILSLQQLTNAYGMMMCGQGIANLIGPPIAGLLYDYTGSYNATFIAGGVCIAISGFMMFSVSLIEKCDNAREQRHLQRELDEQRRHLADKELSAAVPLV
ncbi:monocarboxylate transporter 12-B-like [Tubulanus polymorphus]|uniref:monocarboxylate transporter 12-B-like n=1 Tax=Tubulanus polymorphus TaxID=672921 RepID=UPI003DA434C7